jgi:putative transposase
MITGATHLKQHLFDTPEKLQILNEVIFEVSLKCNFQLEAWAILSNHYHLVGIWDSDQISFKNFIKAIHGKSAIQINRFDGIQGRKVWFQYWDTHLTFEKSYLSRLKYVHLNPQRHNVVVRAEDYPFCSANWFFLNSDRAWYETIMSFPIDDLSIRDDF